MTVSGMKWIVGLDLRPQSQGAIRFAAWLCRNSQASGGERLIGVHVLEEKHLQAALRYHHLDELVSGAGEAAEQVIDRIGASDQMHEFHVVQGGSAERSLEAARIYHHAHGLIIGRYAKREGRHVLRLGRVARRVIRQMATPVVVVPPDYDPTSAPDGPIIASCNLREDADDALTFAASMAQRLGRDLVIAHVVPLPDDYGAHYIPPESLAKIQADHQQEGERELATWADVRGQRDCERVVIQGGVVEQLVNLASERKACMLVGGSRCLSTFERLLLTSVGTELAATAPCPVALVPPAPVADPMPGIP